MSASVYKSGPHGRKTGSSFKWKVPHWKSMNTTAFPVTYRSLSDPKIAMHNVAAKYAVGDGDAATMETHWTTSVVLTIKLVSEKLCSPLKSYTPS
jgi:hypothetical protein